MRYIITMLICFCGFVASVAQEKIVQTVETTAKGQLWEKIVNEYQEIDSLVVVGPIDKSDFEAMWKCCWHGQLTGIDLSKAIPENNEIPESAFFKENVQESNGGAATGQLQLEWITLPESLGRIGDGAFTFTKIRGIKIPETVTSIGESAFYATLELKNAEIVLPPNLTKIAKGCFGYSNVSKVILSEGVKEIEDFAFMQCKADEIVMPENGVETIGQSVFVETYVSRLVLPNSVVSLGGWNLVDTYYLEEVKFSDGIAELNEIFPEPQNIVKKITLPANLKVINESFNRCFDLPTIIFPASLESATASFKYAGQLRKIYACGTLPARADAQFLSDSPDDAVLYVPVGTANAYRQAEGWKNVKNIVELEKMPSTGVESVEAESGLLVECGQGCLTVYGNQTESFEIYDIGGTMRASGQCSAEGCRVALPRGVYILRSGVKGVKVML